MKKGMHLMALATMLAGAGVGMADSTPERPPNPLAQPAGRPANPLAQPAERPENPLASGGEKSPAPAAGGFANPLDQTVPDVRNSKPPEWVKPGARIAYWLGSGTFNSTGHGLFKPDANGEIQDTNGNRYSRQEGSGNVASAGYLVYTVHAVNEKGEVLLTTENYGISGLGEGVTPGVLMVQKLDASTGAGIWIAPEKLAQAKPSDQGGLRIMVGPWSIDGKVYNAVCIAASGASTTYDRTTGMLISSLSKSTTKKQAGFSLDGNTLTPERGETTTSVVSQFKGFRYLKLPWIDQPRPQWVAKGTRLEYRIARWMEVPGVEPLRLMSDVRYEVKETGEGWVRTDRIAVMEMNQPVANPQPMEQYAGNNGGLWMNPKVLQTLKPGQVLDEDRLLGLATTVSNVGQLPNGRQFLEIQTRGAQFSLTTAFDVESGVAIRIHQFERPISSHVQIDLTRFQPAVP